MENTDAESLIREQLLSGTVWNHPDFMEPCEGLAAALRGSAGAELIVACNSLITDPDVRIRSGIVFALSDIIPALGTEWLAICLDEHPDLFTGVEPVGATLNQSDLRKEMLVAMGNGIRPGETRSLELLKEAAKEEVFGMWLIPSLARVDGEWLVEHTHLIPHRMISALLPLTPEQRKKVLYALVPWPEQVIAKFPPAMWNGFSDEEAKKLQAEMDYYSYDATRPDYVPADDSSSTPSDETQQVNESSRDTSSKSTDQLQTLYVTSNDGSTISSDEIQTPSVTSNERSFYVSDPLQRFYNETKEIKDIRMENPIRFPWERFNLTIFFLLLSFLFPVTIFYAIDIASEWSIMKRHYKNGDIHAALLAREKFEKNIKVSLMIAIPVSLLSIALWTKGRVW